ncbi:MAG: hypothetical protein ACPLRU_08890 [Desulfofundulus sp.]
MVKLVRNEVVILCDAIVTAFLAINLCSYIVAAVGGDNLQAVCCMVFVGLMVWGLCMAEETGVFTISFAVAKFLLEKLFVLGRTLRNWLRRETVFCRKLSPKERIGGYLDFSDFGEENR